MVCTQSWLALQFIGKGIRLQSYKDKSTHLLQDVEYHSQRDQPEALRTKELGIAGAEVPGKPRSSKALRKLSARRLCHSAEKLPRDVGDERGGMQSHSILLVPPPSMLRALRHDNAHYDLFLHKPYLRRVRQGVGDADVAQFVHIALEEIYCLLKLIILVLEEMQLALYIGPQRLRNRVRQWCGVSWTLDLVGPARF